MLDRRRRRTRPTPTSSIWCFFPGFMLVLTLLAVELPRSTPSATPSTRSRDALMSATPDPLGPQPDGRLHDRRRDRARGRRRHATTCRRRETLGIVGESGSGKSVSSMAILGLLPEDRDDHRRGRSSGGENLIGRSEKRAAAVRGEQDRDDLPGCARVAEPGATRSATRSREAITRAPRPSKDELRERVIELLDIVGIPNPSERADAVPARVLGRHAPAGDDRDGDRQRSRPADRRRADDRARRDDPGPGARGARAHPGPHRRRRSC